MTLCIAAACHERKKPRIVVGTDNRIETYMAGADIQSKLFWFGEGPNDTAVLIAGNVSRAMQVGEMFKLHQEKLEELCQARPDTKIALTDMYKVPLIQYKHKLADEYTGREYGLSYKAFREAVAAKQIPERVAESTMEGIRRIHIDCSLILAFFAVENVAMLMKIEEDSSLEDCEHFAAIGSGALIADGVLYQREHSYGVSLNTAIYHVYEAMKLGSIAPGVSRDSINIAVLYPPGEIADVKTGIRVKELTADGYEAMERLFERKGPRRLTRAPSLPRECFELWPRRPK